VNPVVARSWSRGLGRGFRKALSWLARNWVWAVSLLSLAYLGFALLAPVLMAAGHPIIGRLIYAAYAPLCHQWPDRSYFLFGTRLEYSFDELRSWLGTEVTRNYVGDQVLGYKTAMCQRCLAMFGMISVAGLLYGARARRGRVVTPLSWWIVGLLLVPVVVDGGGQLLGLWESTWWSRSMTGMLFGIAWVGWVYPRLGNSMTEVLLSLENHSRSEEVAV